MQNSKHISHSHLKLSVWGFKWGMKMVFLSFGHASYNASEL